MEAGGRWSLYIRDDVIGRFDDKFLPPDPRSRKVYDEPKYTGYRSEERRVGKEC